MSNESKTDVREPLGSTDGLDDALRILIRISNEYENLCDVMLRRSMLPERKNELTAASRFMTALEKLRDELLKRKSSNTEVSDRRTHGNDNTTGANGGSLH